MAILIQVAECPIVGSVTIETISSSLRPIQAMLFREYSRDRTEGGFRLIPRQGYAHSFSKYKVIKDNTNDSITWYLVTL